MKYLFAGAGLALAIAGCGEGAQSAEEDPVAAEATEQATTMTAEGEAVADAPTADNGRAILSGPVSGMALDVDPVMVTMRPDGAERDVFLELASGAANAFDQIWEGVGNPGVFDCAPGGPFVGDDGATYDTFTDCRLAP